jgi:hypothetical protein
MRFRAPAGEALVVHCNVGRERVEGDLARVELRPGHVLDEADAGRAQTRPSLRRIDEELGERHDALQGIRNAEVAAVVIHMIPTWPTDASAVASAKIQQSLSVPRRFMSMNLAMMASS